MRCVKYGFHGTKRIRLRPSDTPEITQHIYPGPISEFDRAASDTDLGTRLFDHPQPSLHLTGCHLCRALCGGLQTSMWIGTTRF